MYLWLIIAGMTYFFAPAAGFFGIGAFPVTVPVGFLDAAPAPPAGFFVGGRPVTVPPVFFAACVGAAGFPVTVADAFCAGDPAAPFL